MSAHISAKWRPGHRVYRNDDTGEFAEVNCPLLSLDECRVQRALLRQPSARKSIFFVAKRAGQEATRDAA
jgi:hypothetical protein